MERNTTTYYLPSQFFPPTQQSTNSKQTIRTKITGANIRGGCFFYIPMSSHKGIETSSDPLKCAVNPRLTTLDKRDMNIPCEYSTADSCNLHDRMVWPTAIMRTKNT